MNEKSDIRESIERAFGKWGEVSNRYPWLIILVFALLVAGFSYNLKYLKIDTSNEGLLSEDNPVRIAYNNFRYQFGRDERVILIVETYDSIYNTSFLRNLESLHKDLEANAARIESVDSLINARRTYGEGDSLIVEDLLDNIPEGQEALVKIAAVTKSNPMYQGQFISDSDSVTFIYIETDAFSSEGESDTHSFDEGFDDGFSENESIRNKKRSFLSGEENKEVVDSIDAIVAKHQAEGFRIMVGGSPHFMNTLLVSIMDGMTMLTVTVIALIAIILMFIFRRPALVLLPLLVAILSVTLTVSIMSLLGFPFTVVLQLMPVLLLAVGVSNSIHIFNAFFQSISEGNKKQAAIVDALEHSGLAIAMSTFTTVCGLLSFGTAELAPVAHFGLFSAVGIMLSFLFSVGLLPAIIRVIPISETIKPSSIQKVSQAALDYMGRVSFAHPYKITLVWIVLCSICIVTVADVRLSHLPIKWLLPTDPSRISMERLDAEFGGSMSLEVVIDTGRENGIKDPVLLEKIDEIYDLVKTYKGEVEVSKAVSLVDIVKETHQALNENRAEFYSIPNDKILLSQELLLFENSGSDDLEKIVDSTFTKTRITLKATNADAVFYTNFQETFYKDVREIFSDYEHHVDITFTGLLAVMGETIPALQNSLSRSYLFAFLTITPIMIFMLGSVRAGLLSMLPNIAPIVIGIGFMGVMGIPMDTFMLMLGSVVLGLAVDDTIHFMHDYQRNYRKSGNPETSIQKSLSSSGQAILFTSLVLGVSFLTYVLSDIVAIQNFGLLLSFCMTVAFLADVLLAPALVTIVHQIKTRKKA